MAETIDLNGEQVTLGVTKLVMLGINMRCEPVICTGYLYKLDEGYSIKTGGIYVAVTLAAMADLYVDTPANRKTLKSQMANA